MEKRETINKIYATGIVPVVRAKNAEQAIKITEAIKAGGINVIEITMTVPGALGVIKELSDRYKDDPDMLIGAGSVLDGITARQVILAGAKFVVGPSLDLDMIKVANLYQVPVIPGAMTPTEVAKAMEAGAEIIKIFPATLFGPKIIKAIKGPIPQANLLPTGGVNIDNAKDWFDAGSFAVGAGSAIVDGAESGDYKKVEENARQFAELISTIR